MVCISGYFLQLLQVFNISFLHFQSTCNFTFSCCSLSCRVRLSPVISLSLCRRCLVLAIQSRQPICPLRYSSCPDTWLSSLATNSFRAAVTAEYRDLRSRMRDCGWASLTWAAFSSSLSNSSLWARQSACRACNKKVIYLITCF